MTADATRDLVRSFLDALNAHDLGRVTSMVSEDVAHDLPGGTREIGAERLREHLARAPREMLGDIVVMSDESGARAAAEFTQQGDQGGTAASYSVNAGYFIEIDEGRITRLTAVGG